MNFPPPPPCNVTAYGQCGSSDIGHTCCPDGYICQPASLSAYQCVPEPMKCDTNEIDIDFAGNDLGPALKAADAGECCNLCFTTANCHGFTWYQGSCALKTTGAGRTTKRGAISGLRIIIPPSAYHHSLFKTL